MIEHPQFFWYKRYVAWSELLTIVKLCTELSVTWDEQFSQQQKEYIEKRVMSSKVLDCWFETNDSKEHVG
jgi:HEPN domain-containing protein